MWKGDKGRDVTRSPEAQERKMVTKKGMGRTSRNAFGYSVSLAQLAL